MDRVTSFALGRPCAIQDEESVNGFVYVKANADYRCRYDIDLMTEVDDEYWTNPDPALAFKQPPGKPSKIAFVNQLNRLLKVLAFASRTIVSEACLSA